MSPNTFEPHLEQLSPELREVWPRLSELPSHCILYGSTALSLRLDHEQAPPSLEVKTARRFDAERLREQVPFLQEARFEEPSQEGLPRDSFIQATLETSHGPVQLTIEGDCRLAEIHKPDRCPDNGLALASVHDLGGSKLLDVATRSNARDYRDIAALVERGHSVGELSRCAEELTFHDFKPRDAIFELSSFPGALSHQLSDRTKDVLEHSAVQAVEREDRSVVIKAHACHLSMESSDFMERTARSELSRSAQRDSLKLNLNKELERGYDREL